MQNGVAFRHLFCSIALSFVALLALVNPAAAQDKVPPLSAYGELPGVEELVISPSGDRVAMLVTLSGRRQLLVLSKDMKVLTRFPVDTIKVRSFDFISEDHILLRRSATQKLGYGFLQDKLENHQALIVSVSDGKVRSVFGNRRDIASGYFGFYGIRMVDGRPHGFFGGIVLRKRNGSRTQYVFDHGRPALFSVDLTKNAASKVAAAPRPGRVRDWLVGENGTILARLDIEESSGKWEISNGKRVLASGKDPAGRVFFVSVGRDGSTIIYGARKGGSKAVHWYEVPVDGSREPEIVFDKVHIERIYTDRQTGQMIGYLRDTGKLEPVFFDPDKTAKAKKIRAAFATLENRMVDWTRDFGQVIVRTAGNRDSGTYFKVDLTQLKAEAVAWERPLIAPAAVGEISSVEYTASDGLEMDGILTLPPGREPKNLPLVMLPHGGPHSHDSAAFNWWAQAFASRGYAVFQPNFRGSTNRSAAFIRAGYGEWGGKMQSDISDGLAMLAEKGIVDPKRACIVGASYGGYAALAGVTLQQGLYRCAVSVAGVSDVGLLSSFDRRESGYSKIARASLAEQLGPSSRFKDISPRHQAGKADAPILLIHGRDDTVVEYEQSRKMADALKDAGKPFEFVELKGEDHWLSLGETRQAMLKSAVAFVEKNNPPD